MSICRDLVELMGGEIIVDSKKGSGTAISFIIEFENGNIKNLPVKQNFAFDADMLANKKILVVDDNKMNRLVAATILKNMGAIISEAVNGQEAIDALVIEMADLVLMDIQMPVMDGVEAIGIIRKQISKSLPVIALTANAIKGDNDKYIQAGMSAYLSKPYKEKDLLNMVAFWLGKVLPVKDEVETIRHASYNHLYDLSGLRQISKNNEGFVQKMAELFVAQTPALVAEMIEKYYEGEYKAMSAIAHKIKPSIDNMGIASLKDTIIEIEKKGKFEKDDKALPGLLEFIKITLLKVVELLKNEFSAKETGAFI
jgi:CheY-like chemotaxis protein